MALIEQAFGPDIGLEFNNIGETLISSFDQDDNIDEDAVEYTRNNYFNPDILKCELEKRRDALRIASDDLTKSEQILNKNNADIEKLTSSIQSLSLLASGDVRSIIDDLNQMSKNKVEIKEKTVENVKMNKQYVQILTNMVSQTKHLCSLCMSNAIEVAVVPCGHVACFSCMQRASQESCFGCRGNIDHTLKLFFI